MELCTSATRAISTLAVPHHHRPFSTSNPTHFRFKTSLLLPPSSLFRTVPDLRYLTSPLRGATHCYKEERDGVITLEGGPSPSPSPSPEKNAYNETLPTEEVSKEEFTMDEQTQWLELLDKLNIQFDTTDTSSILLFGSGAIVALWFASAIVGAIDSIPVFPKLMEVVGLAYTFWFSTRYLLFKKNRDELGDKIEEIKQQVLGSNED